MTRRHLVCDSSATHSGNQLVCPKKIEWGKCINVKRDPKELAKKMTWILDGNDPCPDLSMVEMFTTCKKISDPPGNAKRFQIKGYCVERQDKSYFGTFIDKFGDELTQREGTATVSYADVFVESTSLLMTVLKFDSVFFRPVNLSLRPVDLSPPEDDINERSPKKQKLSQL